VGLEAVYNYLIHIGLDGNSASHYVTQEWQLVPKSGKTFRFLETLVSCRSHRLGPVIASFRSWQIATPLDSTDRHQKCEFIVTCLEHVKAGRDPHLKILALFNQLKEAVTYYLDETHLFTHAKLLEDIYLHDTSFAEKDLQASMHGLLALVRKASIKAKVALAELPSINIVPLDVMGRILFPFDTRTLLQLRRTCKIWNRAVNKVLAAARRNRLLNALKPKDEPFTCALVRLRTHLASVRKTASRQWEEVTDMQDYTNLTHSPGGGLHWLANNTLHYVKEFTHITLPSKNGESWNYFPSYSYEKLSDGILLKEWNLKEREVEKYYKIKVGKEISTWRITDGHFIYLSDDYILYRVDLSDEKLESVALGSVPQNVRLHDKAIYFKDPITGQFAMCVYGDTLQAPVYFPHSHNSSFLTTYSFLTTTNDLLLLRSEQNNILVYSKQTRERLGSYPAPAGPPNDLIFLDGGIIYTFSQHDSKIRATDICSKKTVVVSRLPPECGLLHIFNGLAYIGRWDANLARYIKIWAVKLYTY